MNRIFILLLCCCFLSTTIFAIGNYRQGDTLYSWAYHGLNLRKTASVKGARIVTIPYGERMVILDSVKVKAYSIEEFPGFSIQGHWSKVKYGNIEGWVFDGYLSKYPAINLADVDKPWRNKFPVYGKKAFGLLSKKRFALSSDLAGKDSLNFRDVYQFQNGVVFEFHKGGGDGGWSAVHFKFPDLSFEECYLFFVYNSDFFKYDPNHNPQNRHNPFFPKVSNKHLNYLEVTLELCGYKFEKKGKMTHIEIFCSC